MADITDVDLPGDETSSKAAALEKILEERSGVKEEILKLIEPYRESPLKSITKTPFTLCEMIVMAVLCSDSVAPSRKAIFDWIIRTFRFCRESIQDAFFARLTDGSSWGYHSVGILKPGDWEEAFRTYDMPILASDESARQPANDSTPNIFVPLVDGRYYLSHLLNQPRRGTLRFLDLPAEIRVMIYEMAVWLPASGLFVAVDTYSAQKPGLYAISRAQDSPSVVENVADKRSPQSLLTLLPRGIIFALLNANKQIREEALPCFWRVNQLYFSSTVSLYCFLKRLPPSRLQWLAHVSVWWDRASRFVDGEGAFKLLAKCPKLKRLSLRIDQPWKERKEATTPTTPDEIAENTVGIQFLTRVNVREVVFLGSSEQDAPEVVAYIKSKLAETRAKNTVLDKSKKGGSRSKAPMKKGKKEKATTG